MTLSHLADICQTSTMPTTVSYSKFRDNFGKHLKDFISTEPGEDNSVNGSVDDEIFEILYKPKKTKDPAQVAAYVLSPEAYTRLVNQPVNVMSMFDMDTPAVKYRSHHYPAKWGEKVPATIRTITTVQAGIGGMPHTGISGICIPKGANCPCWVNSHGVVYAWMNDSRKIQLKENEFEVTSWHEGEVD